MNRNILRGIIVLIVLIGIAGVFLLIDKDTETETVYNPPSEEEWQKIRQDLAARKAQDAAEPQSQGENREIGHRHADGTWHEGAHEPIAQPALVSQTYTGPLTYHKELLEKHPVEALRQQTIERGHWSAEWIPPFPPDDEEAARVARNKYLLIYYGSIGDTDNPAYKEAYQDLQWYYSINSKRYRSVLEPYLDESGLLDKSLDFATRQELIQRDHEVRTRRGDIFQLQWGNLSPEDLGDLSLYGSPSDPAAPPIMDDR